MRITFIHAADLHIECPLAGLSLKDEAVAKHFANAGLGSKVLIGWMLGSDADKRAFAAVRGFELYRDFAPLNCTQDRSSG
jgi:hypothetical protein